MMKPKALILTSLILFLNACSYKKPEWVEFNHHFLSLKYPSSWNEVYNAEMVLMIKKNTLLESQIEGENPSVIITATDTIEINLYGYDNVRDYAIAFSDYHTANSPKWELKKALDSTVINGIKMYYSTYDIESEYMLTKDTFMQSQTHFFFESLEAYLMVILTTPKDYEKGDIINILNTITIPTYTPIEEIL